MMVDGDDGNPGGEGTPPAGSGWKSALGDDVRSAEVLGRFTDDPAGLSGIVRELQGSQKLLGKDRLPLPSGDEDADGWNEVYKRLGRPEKPEEYDLQGFERPQQAGWDEDFEKQMLGAMHAAGLSQRQVRALFDVYGKGAAQQVETLQGRVLAAREEAKKGLQKEWGSAYDGRVRIAQQAAEAIFGDKLQAVSGLQLADGTMLFDHPEMVRAFAGLGAQLQEADILGDKTAPGTMTGLSPEEADRELAKFMAESDHTDAWLDNDHPKHSFVVRRRAELMAAIHPGTEARVGGQEGGA